VSATQQTLDLLTQIRDGIREGNALLRKLTATTGAAAIASDKDLDGKYGDEEVRFNPKDWTGTSMKGKRMSKCPPEFLDLLAETFDYFAGEAEEKNETYNGKPVAPYKRKSAARARGWAKRIREGKVKQEPVATRPQSRGWGGDDEDEAGFEPR
jgi:hypothetical protein